MGYIWYEASNKTKHTQLETQLLLHFMRIDLMLLNCV